LAKLPRVRHRASLEASELPEFFKQHGFSAKCQDTGYPEIARLAQLIKAVNPVGNSQPYATQKVKRAA
jgi:hypothetical protein